MLKEIKTEYAKFKIIQSPYHGSYRMNVFDLNGNLVGKHTYSEKNARTTKKQLYRYLKYLVNNHLVEIKKNEQPKIKKSTIISIMENVSKDNFDNDYPKPYIPD